MPAAAADGEARLPMLSLEDALAVAEEVGLPGALAKLNVFRTLLRRPKTAKAIADLLLSLLFGGELNGRLRELVIMRIGWATGCDYEWTQHWPIAQEQFGCTPEDLLAVRDPENAAHFGEPERAVLGATDETLATGAISAATWQRCEAAVGGQDACLELVAAISTWRLISQLALSVTFPLEEGVASWPPDGARPDY